MFTPTKYPTAAQYLYTQQLLHEKDGGEFDKMYPMAGDIRRMLNDLNTLNKRYDILAMHMAEVKAIADGCHENTLSDVVEHCLEELEGYNAKLTGDPPQAERPVQRTVGRQAHKEV